MASSQQLAQGLRSIAQQQPVMMGNPALSGAEQYGDIMKPATASTTKKLAAGLRSMVDAMGGPLATRMAAHGEQQKARMAAGDYSPTPLTGESIDLADSVAGSLVGNIGLAGALRAYHGSQSGARLASAALDVPASANKAFSNVLTRDAENLSKLAVSSPLFVKGSGAVDVKARADVLPVMRRLLKDREVAQSVVGLVPVDVMDMLRGQKLSAEALLDNPSMLVDLLPASAKNAVAVGAAAKANGDDKRKKKPDA